MPVLRRAVWLAAGLAAFAFSFEFTARLDDLIRYGMPLASPYGSEADLVVHDSLGKHGRPGAQYSSGPSTRLGREGPRSAPGRHQGCFGS